MNIQNLTQRWFVIVTILMCVVLALLFGAIQVGMI
jgi:hypothetical protein